MNLTEQHINEKLERLKELEEYKEKQEIKRKKWNEYYRTRYNNTESYRIKKKEYNKKRYNDLKEKKNQSKFNSNLQLSK